MFNSLVENLSREIVEIRLSPRIGGRGRQCIIHRWITKKSCAPSREHAKGKQCVLWTLDCRCFPRICLGKHRQSRVHKTYCFPRSQSISVNYFIPMSKTKHPANMVLSTESGHFVHISALLTWILTPPIIDAGHAAAHKKLYSSSGNWSWVGTKINGIYYIFRHIFKLTFLLSKFLTVISTELSICPCVGAGSSGAISGVIVSSSLTASKYL